MGRRSVSHSRSRGRRPDAGRSRSSPSRSAPRGRSRASSPPPSRRGGRSDSRRGRSASRSSSRSSRSSASSWSRSSSRDSRRSYSRHNSRARSRSRSQQRRRAPSRDRSAGRRRERTPPRMQVKVEPRSRDERRPASIGRSVRKRERSASSGNERPSKQTAQAERKERQDTLRESSPVRKQVSPRKEAAPVQVESSDSPKRELKSTPPREVTRSRSPSEQKTPPRKSRQRSASNERTPSRRERKKSSRSTEKQASRSKSSSRTPPRERRLRSRSAENTPPREASRRSPSGKKTPPRESRRRSSSTEKTPPREAKRAVSAEKTPPPRIKRESKRSPSSGPQTPPRKSVTKKERRRERKRRASISSSESSSGSSSDESTPPRRSRKKEREPKRERAEKAEDVNSAEVKKEEAPVALRANIFTADGKSGRTGGVYIPPFKLAQMRRNDENPNSAEAQRRTWDALRKSLNGLINKVNVSNISNIIPELFQENLVRGRGLLARSIMKAQLASPGFTHIYAALVAVINTKMPENGELIVKRVIYRFRRSFKRGDKVVAIALVRFIAHLVNQQVVHELVALEVLTLLLANPTDDSVEVAVNFTKECGQILNELCPEGLRAIFERFRGILHEGEIDKRVQYTIEGLFAIRKGGFVDYPAVHEQLDLVESGDQIVHENTLEEAIDCEDKLDVFRFDPEYEENEKRWTAIKKEILGESDSDSDGCGSSGSDAGSSDEEEPTQIVNNNAAPIQDYTEQDLVNLRRTIYLTIMSSISHEECAHKLMKLNIRPGQEKEVCSMLIECCSQERTYLRYYGLLGQRFCLIKREFQDSFDECFAEQYSLIHRLETNKLRNVAKFFAHLLFTDALPWTVFEYVRLNEEDTTSSSRIFIKILCQELSEHLGLKKLKERFFDPIMQETFGGMFPRDNPRNTRFAINFFTSIGLGGITTELREYLKNAPKMIMAQAAAKPESDSDSDSSSDSSSSSSSNSSSSSDSDSSDSSSDSSSGSDSD